MDIERSPGAGTHRLVNGEHHDQRREITAADGVVQALVAGGIDVVFGLPGEENLPLVSALRRAGLELVVCRHEQHAAFMAVAHARLTEGPAVCLATLGPGALNLFTGLAQAQALGVPVLALTGQKPVRGNEEGSFQVIDVVGSARPLLTEAVTASDPATAATTVAAALGIAVAERGAVLVELPEDVAAEQAPTWHRNVAAPAPTVADDERIELARSVIRDADRPIVLLGSMIPHSVDVQSWLARGGLAGVTLQMANGMLDPDTDQWVGQLGMHRPDFVNTVLDDADLVVAIGVRPNEHPPQSWNRARHRVIHIDRLPARRELGYEPVVEVVGRVDATLDRLRDLDATPWTTTYRHAIRAALEDDLAALGPTSVGRIPAVLSESLDPSTVIALDNGLYKLWFCRHFQARHRTGLMLDNSLATMGAGLATGMAAARLGRRTVVVTGDGGAMMSIGDLETCRRLELELTVLVLRDDAYGFIEWHQNEQRRVPHGVALGNPDLVMLAEAFGASGRRTAQPSELGAALRAAQGLTVIDHVIDYSDTHLFERDDLTNQLRRRLAAFE